MQESKALKDAKAIFRVASGNFLESYDFAVYGFYAAFIAKVFFPSDNEFISIIQSFAAFGAGFLMRPLGAIILGAYMDKYGRRKGLMLTLLLMAIGTVTIALCPGYESIGILAPIIVIIGRLIQGFSAGAEIGGASIYLAEIAPANLRGFYVSWQSASQQIATVFAGAVGITLYYLIGDLVMDAWGWRIPFIIGCLVIPFLFYIRRTLEETPEFEARAKKAVKKTFAAVFANMIKNWQIIILAIMFVMMTTVTFYFITAFTPHFARNVLGFSKFDAFLVTAIVGVSNLFWLPVSGFVSDKIGRKPILLTMTILGVLTAYPMLDWLTLNKDTLTFGKFIVVELWFSFIFGAYNGAMIVSLSEIMPKDVKALGFSFSYSLAVGIFGGFTPVAATALLEFTDQVSNSWLNVILPMDYLKYVETHAAAGPAFWLTFAALCSLIASLILFRKGGIYEREQEKRREV